ncbi:MAG: beta-glucosidase BglX [Candidatus Pseudobacter hemicellulosilyticus]|uniref:beta-glucosidase n=1 Tax=Candidatus Pseudobacter hemicellulosilyticus TaxID=3121375 RepID=A0AAJ5WVR7_9BACT|nr:MAG: beta-glucosidase BglX [Pseudobacter sp.]
MKRITLPCVLLMLVMACGDSTQNPAYKRSDLPIEDRVKDLLKRMTVEEKAGQFNQLSGDLATGPASGNADWKQKIERIKNGEVGSMLNVVGAAKTRQVQEAALQSRLGIPLFFGYDVIHGYKTIFPIPLAEACSWDLEGATRNAATAALESSSAGVHWTFGPMCDISTDPRWGRVMEGAGEDPWLGAQLAAARVKGLQGNFDSTHILACIKHFAAYGAVEGGKEYNYTDMSRVALWNKYLPPYKAAVEAGAASLMNGFTTFEGVPVTGNKYLVTDVLKDQWGFKGFLVSDWNSIGEMVNWGYATDKKDAADKAFAAGSMIDMETQAMGQYIPELVKEGRISEKDLDDAVGRILYFKFKLGLFDHPYAFCDEQREASTLLNAAHRQQALESAKRAIVLLKNDNKVLPLKKSGQKIALVGLYAREKKHLFDFWIAQGDFNQAVSLQEGMAATFGAASASFSDGYSLDTAAAKAALIQEAVGKARSADVVVVNIGLPGGLAGEDRSMANIDIPQDQVNLLRELKKTGKPVVAVVAAGRPMILTGILELCDAIVYSWILGTEGGNAIAQVLAGDYNPSGKTVMSFPKALGQIPVYYNHFNTGRPNPTDNAGNWYSRYRDVANDPLYPFGYGLSYTQFTYSNLAVKDTALQQNDTLRVSVTVTNSGEVDGEEVAQLYIRDVTASIVRPVKELKGFQKVLLKKGESRELHFALAATDLAFYDATGKAVLEPGSFGLFVGGNSRDVLSGSFWLK